MSDRLFGLLFLALALGFIASASVIQTSFLADPVGPRLFPYIIGGVVAISALVMIAMPDEDPVWPPFSTWLRLLFALIVLVAYAYALRPLGFLIPTAIAAGILSYQINPRPVGAVLIGIGLSILLFAVFKYGLGLGLFAVPREWLG